MTHPNDALEAFAVMPDANDTPEAFKDWVRSNWQAIEAALTQKPPVIEGLDEAIEHFESITENNGYQAIWWRKTRLTILQAARAYQQGHAVPEGYVLVPVEIINFLNGSGPLRGEYFGSPHPDEKGAYWWRKHLRERTITAPTPPQESVDVLHLILENCEASASTYKDRLYTIHKIVSDHLAIHNISKKGG